MDASVLASLWLLSVPDEAPGAGRAKARSESAATKGVAVPNAAPWARLDGLVIDSRTRQPIGQVRLGLERGTADAPGADAEGVKADTVTDTLGRFRLDRLEPGWVRLAAERRGYLPSPSYLLKLNAGRKATRVVMLDALAGVSGRIVDELDRPVGGARVGVVVASLGGSEAVRRFVRKNGAAVLSTTAGSQGQFELFVPAESGKATLAARAPDYAPKLEELSIQGGEERREIVIKLHRGLAAYGRILDEGGAPISGAKIVAHQQGGQDGDGAGLEDLAPRAASDADGGFQLRGLEEGTHTLRVSHPSYAPHTVEELGIGAQGNDWIPDIVLEAGAQITGRTMDAAGQPLAGARVAGVVVLGESNRAETVSDEEGRFVLGQFARGAKVAVSATAEGRSRAETSVVAPGNGQLVLDRKGTLRGRVADAETRAPITRFQVQVTAGQAAASGAEVPEGRTFGSEDGRFEWAGLPAGHWTFAAQAPGYQSMHLPDVRIRPGEPTEEGVFFLKQGAEVAGQVLDAMTGVGVAGATVSYRDPSVPDVPEWRWRLRSQGSEQTTDADGMFRLEGLKPGRVAIVARSSLHAEASREVVAGETTFVEIRLRKGASLSGAVVAADGSAPVPEAWIELWSVASDSGVSIPADRVGAFSFTNLNAGRYTITAEAASGRARRLEILLSENERRVGVLLVTRSGSTIRGRVIGLAPAELEGMSVFASGEGDFGASAPTDSGGAYTIARVPSGWVQLTAETPSSRSISKSIAVPDEPSELSLDFEFPAGARLSGRVTQGDEPVAFATVRASPREPHSVRGVGQTNRSGVYAIDGLDEGDYFISVGETVSGSVHVSGDTTLDIELSAAGR